MNGKWDFKQDLDLETAPNAVRPETHWLQYAMGEGRTDERLWISLQLSPDAAQELYLAFAVPGHSGRFAELSAKAAIAPASFAALRFAIEVMQAERRKRQQGGGGSQGAGNVSMDDMLGTD